MTEPCDLAAIEARRLIGLKKLSPVELTESCLARIEAVNGTVNAIVAMDVEGALIEAREAQEAVMAGHELPLLHGLPVGIKDLEATEGLRTTFGSLPYKDHVPAEDEPTVVNVRRAGGIVIGKTNTPEHGAGGNTVNRVYGATGNPFDPVKTCGGSSGGSAVALATGMVPLATGSDMGGSLRTPASYCGIVGFRPSAGMVPDCTSSVSLSPFAVLGPMGRTVADAHLLLRAQLDVDRRDPYANGDVRTIPPTLHGADLSRIRAAISTDFGVAPVDTGIRRVFAERTKRFRHVFAEAVDRDPELQGVHEAFEVLRAIGFVAAFKEMVETGRDQLGPNVIDNTERGLTYSMADVARGHVLQTQIYRRFLSLFDDVDVLIAPAVSVSPFPHAERAPMTINGEAMPTYMRWLAIVYGPTMGLATVCCLPCGRDHMGMPFGIQVIGPRGADARVLEVAQSLESVLASDLETARPIPDLSKLRAR